MTLHVQGSTIIVAFILFFIGGWSCGTMMPRLIAWIEFQLSQSKRRRNAKG